MQALRRLFWVLLPILMVLSITPAARSQDATADQAKASFQKGEASFNSMDFKEAKVCFLEANKNPKSLSDADQTKLADYLGKIDPLIKKQAAGYEAFNGASAALTAGDLAKAKDGFTQAADNDCLPAQMRKDAKAQLALVNERMRVAATPVARPEQSLKTVAVAGPAATPAASPAVAMPPASPVATPATKPWPAPAPAPKAGPTLAAPAPAKSQADQAKALVDTGKQKIAANKPDEAVKDFGRAIQLDPTNADAKAGLETARNMMVANDNTPIGLLTRNRNIAYQAAEVEFEAAMKRSDDALRGADSKAAFDTAADALKAADNVLENNKMYYPADQFRLRKDQVQRQDALITDRKTAWDLKGVGIQQEEIRKAALEQKKQAEAERRNRISILTEHARALGQEKKYVEEKEAYEQILKLDPTNSCAADMVAALEQLVLLKQERQTVSTQRIEEHKVLNDIRESEIPWYEYLLYPHDWREITARRKPFGADQGADESEEARATREKLNRKILKVDLKGVELSAAIDWLQDVAGVDIQVQWEVLRTAAAGIEKNAEVNVRLTDKTVDAVLNAVLSDVGGVNSLGYSINKYGVVIISTSEAINKDTSIVVYDIRDLIINIPNFVGPRIDLSSATSSLSGSTGGANGGTTGGTTGGTSVFGTGNNTTGEQEPTKTEIIKGITDMIKSKVAKESWDAVGDPLVYNGQLVITQTAQNHALILSLINKLREAKALQIAIEARFIQVDTSFLQSIGVNLDMYFNTGSRLGSSATVDPWTSSIVGAPQTVPQSRNGNTGAQTASGWGAGAAHWNELTPVPVVGNNTGINFTTPTSLKTGTGLDIGSLVTTPAMTTGFTFLDEIQVNFLLQATQASATTRNLTAPRITLFNGQRAYVSVATEQAYVSGLTAVPSEGTGTVGVGGTVVNSPTYTPTISYVPTGATLDVEATISADRRYVTMTLRPQVCTLVSFATYAVNGVANSVSSQGNISLPTVVIQDIQTTVSVPDGGTLLLGGQKLATETDREIGVPVLSKIPVIDRLFTSRGTERDEETLLILVKPKIIIQKEEEEKSFP